MIRTTHLVAFLFTGLAIQALPASAQTQRILFGGGEPQTTAPASAALLFPQPSLPLFESNLRFERLRGLNAVGSFAEPAPRVELLMAFANLQEAEDPDRDLKKYVGVGLMVIGGINTLYSLNCVVTAHAWGNACWPYLGVSVGIGVGGWVLYKRNR
jgi:hypothetical protein